MDYKRNNCFNTEKMKLEDLCGIKDGNARRLKSVGIYTPLGMFYADSDTLKRGFHSIIGRDWWQKYMDLILRRAQDKSIKPLVSHMR